MTLASNRGAVERAVAEADLVIGACPGRRTAGHRWSSTSPWCAGMRPGAVIVDVAVDQGGCIETTHETTHDDPVYEVHGVLHYAVGNIPGAVPNTSTYALTNATLSYLAELAEHGLAAAVARTRRSRSGSTPTPASSPMPPWPRRWVGTTSISPRRCAELDPRVKIGGPDGRYDRNP